MNNHVSHFMNNHFNNLTLRPPLFYLWKYGIRFEIAMPWGEHEDPDNLNQIEERSNRIFESVFNDGDEMLVITDIQCEKNDRILQRRSTLLYQKYIKNKELRQQLQHMIVPSVFLEDEEGEEYADMVTHRFVLTCQKGDLCYKPLLTTISHEDFSHPSKILKGVPRSEIDVFFVNVTRKMIYHLYDDRGCDVIAANKEELRFLYEEFNDWILDYDRKQIDQVFN